MEKSEKSKRRSLTHIAPCVSHHALDNLFHEQFDVLFPPRSQGIPRRHTMAALPRQPAPDVRVRKRAVSYEAGLAAGDAFARHESFSSVDSGPARHDSRSSVGSDETDEAPAGAGTEATAASSGDLFRIASLATVLIVSGLFTNIAFEMLSKHDPGSSGLLTLFQYAVALVSCARHAPTHLTSPAIPYHIHATFCVLMLCTAWFGNRSVEFNLPFPLYLIIKSSNLVASMAVGVAAGKRYTRGQIVGCVGMTAGVVLSTLVARSGSASGTSSAGGAGGAGGAAAIDASLLTGASLCALSTLCMAMLGVAQERAFRTHGQHHEEAIFYIHAIGAVPLLALQAEAPLARMQRWAADPLAARLCALVALNLGACQLCKYTFFELLGETSSLSASLCILAYRFLGVLVSALIFNSPPPPSPLLFVGVALVTMGGLAYLRSSQPAAPRRGGTKQD